MELRIKGNDRSFHVPTDIGHLLLALNKDKVEEVERGPQRIKFNPRTTWEIKFKLTKGGEQVPAIVGKCSAEGCDKETSSSGATAHKTVFLTHCGIAQDRPPKHIVDEYERLIQKAEPTVEQLLKKVKYGFSL